LITIWCKTTKEPFRNTLKTLLKRLLLKFIGDEIFMDIEEGAQELKVHKAEEPTKQ
jgi:hypothetical protein